MSHETFEDDARLIEDALVYMGCSDCALSPSALAFFGGYRRGFGPVQEALRSEGLTGGDLNREENLPGEPVHAVTGAARNGDLLEVSTIARIGFLERQRLNRLGVAGSDGSLCRWTRRTIRADGGVNQDSFLFLSTGGHWKPLTGYLPGQQFQSGGRQGDESRCTTEPMTGIICTALWARRRKWSVEFRLPNSPGVWFLADSVGARELLRMRDLPAGRSRRDALLHWVREHWRADRHDAEAEIQVRQHLRGAEVCSWFGLECRIVPSEVDLNADTPRTGRAPRRQRGARRS
jgi:hypothetical protein